MKSLKTWLVTGLISLFLLVGGCGSLHYYDGKYDFSTYRLQRSAETIKWVANHLHPIKTVATLRMNDGEPVEQIQYGFAFSVDGKYLIALKHVCSVDPNQRISTPMGTIEFNFTKLDEKHYLVHRENDYEYYEIELNTKISKDSDVAILWKDGVTFETLPVKIGNSDELEVGQSLIVSRTPQLLGHGITTGTVANIGLWDVAKQAFPGDPAFSCFMMDTNLIEGDSGNPVFALRDGTLELIGINQGTLDTMDLSVAIDINSVMDIVNKLIAEIEE